MSSRLKQADDIRRRVEAEGRYKALADALDEFDVVEHVDKRYRFIPSRVSVSLHAERIPDDVASVIEAYDATIVPDTVTFDAQEGRLGFHAEVPPRFVVSGSREMRQYGDYSTSLTFPREALDVSGFDVGTHLDIYAADGAVLLIEAENPPESDGDEE